MLLLVWLEKNKKVFVASNCQCCPECCATKNYYRQVAANTADFGQSYTSDSTDIDTFNQFSMGCLLCLSLVNKCQIISTVSKNRREHFLTLAPSFFKIFIHFIFIRLWNAKVDQVLLYFQFSNNFLKVYFQSSALKWMDHFDEFDLILTSGTKYYFTALKEYFV